jgi:myo-inositol-1(or 4)-monophosphatase
MTMQFGEVCQQVARACGRVLLEMRGTISARAKAPKDVVTEADFASQEVARRLIMNVFPDHRFIGEENCGQSPGRANAPAGGTSEYCWIVDPLDGTLNYVRQLPNYCVSVALRRGDSILAGTVYDPVLDECFSAEAGQGATLNGVSVRTSRCERIEQALVAASLPTEVPRDSPEVRRFLEVMHSAQAIRRLGSAALTLCYVATGRLDAYWATSVQVWDVAAGQLIVREAGGALTGSEGKPLDLDRPQIVTAATPQLHQELLKVLARATQMVRS